MDKYILPLDVDTIEDVENILIDMSTLRFDVPSEKAKRAAFIFLRNANIKAELDFSDCSYEDKKEYLLLYFLEDIEVEADILTTTWLEILSAKDGGGITLPSILSGEEIQLFRQENEDLINEMYQLINSLPIYAMYCSTQNGGIFTTDDFEKTDYHRIKMANFCKLADNDLFCLLIDNNTKPLFYEKIFIKGEYHICKMMEKLPYGNLLSLFTLPPEIQDDAIERIEDLLTPPVLEDGSREEDNE